MRRIKSAPSATSLSVLIAAFLLTDPDQLAYGLCIYLTVAINNHLLILHRGDESYIDVEI